jgi:hypothetical protein
VAGDQRRSDLKRLGRRGSYRLGKLRLQGVGPAGPTPARMPRFGPRRRGPAALWLLAAAAGTAVIAVGAMAGAWAVPFLAGLAAGPASRAGRCRARPAALAVAVMAVAGWGIALAWPALSRAARSAVALYRRAPALPPPPGRSAAPVLTVPATAASHGADVTVTLLAAGALALAGLWLGRVLSARLATPRPPAAESLGPGDFDPGDFDPGDLDPRDLDLAGLAEIHDRDRLLVLDTGNRSRSRC